MKRRLIIVVLAVLVSAACKKENRFDCLKTNGSETTEQRSPGEFHVVRVFDKIDLKLVPSAEYKVEVHGGKNILSNIITRLENGVLEIENKNTCNFVRGYKRVVSVTVYLPRLDRIENNGVGTVWLSDDFKQDSIFLRAESSGDIHAGGTYKKLITSSHGNGDIYLRGQCEEMHSFLFGTNSLRAQQLSILKSVFIESITVGECRINAPENGHLACNIWRSGNIYYKGNPATITNYSDGSAPGRLIKED